MKSVISASRRMDIIAQFYPWFLDRVKEGSVELQNPYFPEKRYTVSLSVDDVQALVLWSKDFTNFVRQPRPLDIYSLYFQYTINLYGVPIENVRPLECHIINLKWIIDNYGDERVSVRFDPVMFIDNGNGLEGALNERLQAFENLLTSIDRDINGRPRIITSFVNLNNLIRKNLTKSGIKIYDCNQDGIICFYEKAKEIAHRMGFTLSSCADTRLEMAGIQRSPCIDGKTISLLEGERVSCAKDTSQRRDCLCTKSIDVGIYPYLDGGKKCIHSCKYCYVKGAI